MTLTRHTTRQLEYALANRKAAEEVRDVLNFLGGYTTGTIFYVDSGASGAADGAGAGRKPDAPFATLDFAIGKCAASNGDTIFVMPGHAETLTADSGVDIDVAGITVIGLGEGAARPTFTLNTAVAADFKIAAASTVIKNLLFLGGIDALTGPIEVSAADCQIIDCEYRDSTGQATDTIVTTADADRLLIDGYVHRGAAAAGANSAIALIGMDDCTIRNVDIYGNFAVGAIDVRTTAAVRLRVHDAHIWTENAADIAIVDTVTGSTGHIGPNVYMSLQDDAANVTEAITGATFSVWDVNVHVVNAVDQKSLAINWTAVADS